MSNSWKDRSPRERKMVIGLVAVVVLGGAMKVMASGGGTAPVAADPGTSSVPVDTTSVPVTPDEPAVEPGAVEHPTGPGSRRDPFEPRVHVAGDSAAVPGQPSTSTDSTGSIGTDAQVTIQLEDVYPGPEGALIALLKLDGTRFRTKVGQTAADLVTVAELTSRCGVFEQGEGSFALCVGQAIERTR